MKKFTVSSFCLLVGITVVLGVVGFADTKEALPGGTATGELLGSVRAGHTQACVDAGIGLCEVKGGVGVNACSANTVNRTCGVNYGSFQEHCTVTDVEKDGDHCEPLLNQQCARYHACVEKQRRGTTYYDCSKLTTTYGWTWNTCYKP